MSALIESLRSGGPLMIPLAALCLGISYWVASLYPRLRRAVGEATELLGCLRDGSNDETLATVRDRCGRRPSLFRRVVEHALAGSADPEEIRARLEEAHRAEIPPFEREIWVLRAMVAAAPLIGLLGTVKGMIETFVGLSARGAATMELLSSGISEALVTTQVGLVVALPGLVGIHAITRRLTEIRTAFDRIASRLAPANGAQT